ncbi:39S ribosomal protein L51, mitochondrial [Vanrija albida]|uniref:Large ribosomal subunit protein mL43 n=1 Tax=Vanrija albida TaxID=181172 RepID=A0ABR3QCY8_9TREE
MVRPGALANLARSVPVPGYNHFLTPLRKIVFDYDAESPSQRGLRSYLAKPLLTMAKENPDIEIVVRKLKRGKAGVIRGHYTNGRDKVICLNGLEENQVANKVDLVLNSSGAKIKPLKNLTLEAGPGGEAARGIWSSLHDASKQGGGYRI